MAYDGFFADVGAMAMGATTYQWVLDNSDEWVYDIPTWVFTHRDFPQTDHGSSRVTAPRTTSCCCPTTTAACTATSTPSGCARCATAAPASAATACCG
jgi:hypothetical protein